VLDEEVEEVENADDDFINNDIEDDVVMANPFNYSNLDDLHIEFDE